MIVWPEEISKSPAAVVLAKAFERKRLGNSLLFQADSMDSLEGAAVALAAKLLAVEGPDAPGRVLRHPDCFVLRPAGKMRIIGVDAVRETIGDIQRSPQAGARKVALVFEADRMNVQSANVFLKTLEEPPLSTTILLLTTRPYSLLSTIRSRCLRFRFPSGTDNGVHPEFKGWITQYREWISQVASATLTDRKAVSAQVLGLYGLIARFEGILDKVSDEHTKQRIAELGERGVIITDEEQDALTAGLSVGVRNDFLSAIERATREFVAEKAGDAEAAALRPPLILVLRKLESCAGLLRANLGTTAALEDFLLVSLRSWARAGAAIRTQG